MFDPERRAVDRRHARRGASNGASFWRKSSYLVGREGDARSRRRWSTIVDDPLIPRAPGSRPFDGDGLPTRKNVVVDEGVLAHVPVRRATARASSGRQSTGSAARGIGGSPRVDHLEPDPAAGHDAARRSCCSGPSAGSTSPSMMGFGFNAVTGDFSRGARRLLDRERRAARSRSARSRSRRTSTSCSSASTRSATISITRSTARARRSACPR